MSHIETVSVVIKDLDAIKAACARLGVEFIEGKKTYAWYGRSIGDYPIPPGLDQSQLGKCDHVIRVPGVEYEVGLVRNKSGAGYVLAYDFWGPGEGLQRKFCKPLGDGRYSKNMEKLVDPYTIEVLKRVAARKGYRSHEVTAKDGSIKLVVNC